MYVPGVPLLAQAHLVVKLMSTAERSQDLRVDDLTLVRFSRLV
jgi:hypothetical protein